MEPHIANLARECPKCHATDRYDSGNCKICARVAATKWNKAHPLKSRLNRQKHQKSHGAYYALKAREYRKKHIEEKAAYNRMYNLRKKYGLTEQQYTSMQEEQGGLCALCSRRKKLVVDHCHSTGKVRGLLCDQCNTGMGMLGDTEESLRRATTYLLSR